MLPTPAPMMTPASAARERLGLPTATPNPAPVIAPANTSDSPVNAMS